MILENWCWVRFYGVPWIWQTSKLKLLKLWERFFQFSDSNFLKAVVRPLLVSLSSASVAGLGGFLLQMLFKALSVGIENAHVPFTSLSPKQCALSLSILFLCDRSRYTSHCRFVVVVTHSQVLSCSLRPHGL